FPSLTHHNQRARDSTEVVMRWLLVALLLTLPAQAFAQAKVAPKPTTLAITGVTVIDTARGRVMPNATVVVTGDRITAVGEGVAVPRAASAAPADGKFLIPGLWDMHAHVESEAVLPLFVGNGVTGVRHMFTGSPLNPPVKDWGKDAEAGKRIGPRIVATTRAI